MIKTSMGLNQYEKDDLFNILGENGLNETIQRINDFMEDANDFMGNAVEQAESIDWLAENGNTSNVYLLPNWHLYEYTTKENVTIKRTVTDDITLTDGIRVGSDGTDRTQAGFCATPHIDLTNIPKPCTIHLTGAKWAYATSSETGPIMFYATKTDGSVLTNGYTSDAVGKGYFTVVKNNGDVTDVTITVLSDEVATIRLSGHWARGDINGTNGGNTMVAKAKLQYKVEQFYETATDWFDTGRVIVSEDRIIKIENDIEDLRVELESTIKVVDSISWLEQNGDKNKVYVTKKGAICVYDAEKWVEYTSSQSSTHLSEEDRLSIISEIMEMLGHTTYAIMSNNNDITLMGEIPDDVYTVKYEMEDESTLDVSSFNTMDADLTFKVINNLTNCTNDKDSITELYSGESYSATIGTSEGYFISKFIVTMGEDDVTNSVVSGNAITIESVTGDIVITAKAVEIASQPNQIPISTDVNGNLFVGTNGEAGYKTNTRIRSSAGDETTSSGREATGYIPVKYGDTIAIENIVLENSGQNSIAFYDANHNFIVGSYMVQFLRRGGTDAVNGEFISVIFNYDKVNTTTINENSGIAYFRFSANEITENSKVIVVSN